MKRSLAMLVIGLVVMAISGSIWVAIETSRHPKPGPRVWWDYRRVGDLPETAVEMDDAPTSFLLTTTGTLDIDASGEFTTTSIYLGGTEIVFPHNPPWNKTPHESDDLLVGEYPPLDFDTAYVRLKDEPTTVPLMLACHEWLERNRTRWEAFSGIERVK